MQIPDRILRAVADEDPTRIQAWTPRQHARHMRILRTATRIFARFGIAAVTFRGLAVGLAISPATLRQHFVDLDSLLAGILSRHLTELRFHLATVAADGADPHAARRQAYLAQTRTETGYTDAHLLWVRERHTLPPDLLGPLEAEFASLGRLLCAPGAAAASRGHIRDVLALLDNDLVTQINVEAFIAERSGVSATPAPAAPPAGTPAPVHLLFKPERTAFAVPDPGALPDVPPDLGAASLRVRRYATAPPG